MLKAICLTILGSTLMLTDKTKKTKQFIILQLTASDICSRQCHVSHVVLFCLFFLIQNLYEAFTMCWILLKLYGYYKTWQIPSNKCQSPWDNLAPTLITTSRSREKCRVWHGNHNKKHYLLFQSGKIMKILCWSFWERTWKASDVF